MSLFFALFPLFLLILYCCVCLEFFQICFAFFFGGGVEGGGVLSRMSLTQLTLGDDS